MPRFKAFAAGNRSHHMAVFGDNHTLPDPVPEAVRRGLRHLPGRFPGRNQHYPARECPAGQHPVHGGVRLYSRNRSPDNPVRVVPQRAVHVCLPPVRIRKRRPAVRNRPVCCLSGGCAVFPYCSMSDRPVKKGLPRRGESDIMGIYTAACAVKNRIPQGVGIHDGEEER